MVATTARTFGRPSIRRRLALAALAASPLLSGGCTWEQARFKQTTDLSAPHVAGSGLKVTSRNGSIVVHKAGTADGQVAISATLRMVTQERLGQATISANRNAAGVLEVAALPPSDGWKSSEGCSFDITVPNASGVDLSSGNGAIEIDGLSGRARLETSNGSIRAANHDGELDAQTSNGRIEASGINGPVHAKTSNGSVTVKMAASSAGPIRIGTSNGSVTLDLSDAFRGTLDVATSNGSIRLPSSAPSGVDRFTSRASGHTGQLSVGQGGPVSEVRTSNGGVTIRFGS